MTFEVTILGSSSATPAYNRNPSAQLLNINEKHYLIDCGEATQNQLNRFKLRSSRINHIFITHLHGDHYLGLVGLISSMHLAGRTADLYIFSPEGLQEIVELQLKTSQTQLRFPLHFQVLDAEKSARIFENEEITVDTIILNHRIPCTGFLFKEKKRPRKINKAALEQYEIGSEHIPLLKLGNDYTDPKTGKHIPNVELTFDSARPRSFAYCSDTIYNESFLEQIKGVDLLYHEATFTHEFLERAEETFHTTAKQAGMIAQKAAAKQLVIGHFSARFKELQPLLEESRVEFAATDLAIEGHSFSVPYTI